MTTYQHIASLMGQLTYEEMRCLAGYLANCANDWVNDGEDMEMDYFASLLLGWADGVEMEAEE